MRQAVREITGDCGRLREMVEMPPMWRDLSRVRRGLVELRSGWGFGGGRRECVRFVGDRGGVAAEGMWGRGGDNLHPEAA